MAFPAGLPLVTLEIQFDTPPDGAAFGSVRVTSPEPLQGPDDDSMVPVIDQVVRLNRATGSASIRLPVVDDPGWTPQDWAYAITASINGLDPIRGTVQLFTGDTTVNLADRLVLTSSVIVPGVTYATLAQLNSGLAGKSDLDHTHAGGGEEHTHPIPEVDDLQVQLDGKQPVGTYLEPDDITNLVSYDTLTEELAGKSDTTHTHSGSPVLIAEQAAPSVTADTIKLYAVDLDGNTVPRMLLPEGIVVDPIRDTTFVVRNATGTTITKGTPVYASGIHPGAGIIPTVTSARADVMATARVIGLMLEDLPNATFGRVMVQGRIDSMNTSGLTTGSTVYLSATTAGQLTVTAPAHPNFPVPLGVVLREHASGGAIAVQVVHGAGNETGTAQDTFAIGTNTAGTKTLQFKNGFTGALSATPTAARTWTLPDQSGTIGLATYQDISTAPTTGTYAVGDIVDTRVGRFRCTVAGTPGTWRWLAPSEAMDHGFAGWMGNPNNIQAGTILAASGTPYVFRFRADTATISAMNLHLTSPGVSLTGAYWTLHNDAGAILGTSAKSGNEGTNLQTGGERTMLLGGAQAVTPGAFYRARFWATTSGGTLPTLSRQCNSSSAAINAGGTLWYASAPGPLTDAASAPDNIGTLTGIATAWWAGFKA